MEINFNSFISVKGIFYSIGEEVNTRDLYIRDDTTDKIYKVNTASFKDTNISDYIIKNNI